MNNPEKLIGKKVRGFKFDDSNYPIGYIPEMDKYIGKKAKIIEYDSHIDSFGVQFKLYKFWYPADQIEAHLVDKQPKFPKVWAWDDKINEAFETYLIAELDECYAWDKRNYKYMVVSKEGLNGFENKSTFDIEFLLNMQPTDPRLNDIITVVEKYGKDFVIKIVEKL
jgi:hypothetical protein